MTEIPTLETERLRLREAGMADWPEFLAMMRSERSRYMGGPYTLAGAWYQFCQGTALWSLFGHGSLILELRDTGRAIGEVGIQHGPLFPEKELGWFVYGDYEGQGYALEGALALRAWAFDELKLETLVSYIDPGNLRSQALARRLGARLDSKAQPQDPGDLVFRHPGPEDGAD